MNVEHRKTQKLSLVALTVILTALSSAGFAESQWTQRADMPTPRRSFTASVVNGKIYVIGGISQTGSNQSAVGAVGMYDTATDTWTQKADNPVPAYAHSASVVDGKIYVMGGYLRGVSPPAGTFQIYDPATDTWTRKTNMRQARANHRSAVVDGKIYLFGGFGYRGGGDWPLLATVSMYEPTTDTWTQKADLPFPWAMPMTGVIDGKIYLCTGFGGQGDWEQVTTLAVYDPDTDTWAERSNLPFGRNDAAAAVVDDKMYVMGGAIDERINGSPVRIPDVIVYDPETDTWADGPPLSRPTRAQAACAADGMIYLIGGATNVPPPDGTPIISRTVEALAVVPPSSAFWPMPTDGAFHPDTWAVLAWYPGIHADSHDVYLSESFDDVNDATDQAYRGNQTEATLIVGFPGYPHPEGLVPGMTYYWRIDEVNDTDPNSSWKGPVWSFTIPPRTAYDPDPADGAEVVDSIVELGWGAGFGAKAHTVYFGYSFDDVFNATEGHLQLETTYLPGALEPGMTYYWRVDEFDGVETHKGDVWSFSTVIAGGN